MSQSIYLYFFIRAADHQELKLLYFVSGRYLIGVY